MQHLQHSAYSIRPFQKPKNGNLESFKPNCLFLTFFWQNYDYFVEDEEARIREMEVMDRLLEVISLEK